MGQASRMYAARDKAQRMMRTRRPLHPERKIKDWQIYIGDTVQVVVGVDAGRQGKVKELIKDRNLLVVEGIRMFSRKMPKMPLVKPEEQGQLINEERALRYEEVMLVDPQVNKPTHTYFEKKYDPASGTTKRMRFSHLSGVVMPIPAKPPAIPTTQAEGERDTSESLVKQVTFTPKMFEAPFPNALLNEIYRMARKGGEGRAL